jgi:hypothetical protein
MGAPLRRLHRYQVVGIDSAWSGLCNVYDGSRYSAVEF